MSNVLVNAAMRVQLAHSIPRLLALTGYGQQHDRERSKAAGFEQHFVKPVALPSLLEAIARKKP